MTYENDPQARQHRPPIKWRFFTLKNRPPVVGRTSYAICPKFSRTPDVPIAFRVIFVGSRLGEPLVLRGSHVQVGEPIGGCDDKPTYLVGGVVNHEVHAEATRHV